MKNTSYLASSNINLLHKIFCCLFILVIAASCHQAKETGEEENRQNEMEGLMRQEFYMTKDPALGYIPVDRKIEAAQQTMQRFATMRTNNFTWEERGPNNVAGRVRAVLIDKRDPSGNTIFSGGVAGGLWKCTNFKTAPVWTKLVDTLPNLAITCIAQDPTNLNVMYAGTGEGWFNVDAVRGNGILKSVDGGNSWAFLPSTQFPTTDDFDYVQDVTVTAAGILYASARSFRFCNRGGVLRSVDGGTTWVRVIGTFAAGSTSCNDALNFRGADLEIASNGDLYATTGLQGSSSNQGRIWKSAASAGTLQGTAGSWTDITPVGTWRRIEVATAPSNPNVVYALMQAGSNNAIGGIRRSDNGGNTWDSLPLPLWCDQGQTSTDFTRTQAWYDLIARVDPNNPLVCYIGGVDILKTIDGGNTWSQVTQWASGCSGLPRIHADQHEILFFGNSSQEMLAGNDGGLYYTSNAGVTWGERNLNFNITQFYSIDLHPSNTFYLLGGTQDNGTQQFTLPGINSTRQVLGGDGGFAHIDQTDFGVIQVGAFTGNNYRYSRNNGNTWDVVQGGSSAVGRFINPTDYDDINDVLIGAHNTDFVSIVTRFAASAGVPMVNAVPLPALNGRQVSAVRVDPNGGTAGIAWVAGSNPTNASANMAPVIIKLQDAHTTSPVVISSFTFPTSLLVAGAYISSIDIEEGNANRIVITASNYGVNSVLESTDGGNSWVNLDANGTLPDIPVRWVSIAPPNALLNGPNGGLGGLIIATELGVWTTSQASGTSTVWQPNNQQFPLTRVDMVKYRRDDYKLAAGTHGRGVFTTTMPSITTGINPVINTRGFIDYVAANQQKLFIKTGSLQGVKLVTVNILDAQGRLVLTEKINYAPRNININKLNSGMYILKIFGDRKETYTQQFVK